MGLYEIFHPKDKAGAEKVGQAWAEKLIANEATGAGTLGDAKNTINKFHTLPVASQKITGLELFYLRIFAIDCAVYSAFSHSPHRNRIIDTLKSHISSNLSAINTIIAQECFDTIRLDSLRELKNQGTVSSPDSLAQLCFNEELNIRMSGYAKIVASVSELKAMHMEIGTTFSELVNLKSINSGFAIPSDGKIKKDLITLAINNFTLTTGWVTKSLNSIKIV